MNGSRFTVLRCERAGVQGVSLAPDSPDAGVCGEHRAKMDGAPWVHDRTRSGILLGDDLDDLLLVVDRAATQVNASWSPDLGTFSTLSFDGRTVGGELATVALVLTDDVVRQLAKLVWMFNRTR